MDSSAILRSGEPPYSLCDSKPEPCANRKIIIALAIITGLAAIALAGMGLAGYGAQQWGWQVGTLSELGRINSIIIMSICGVGGTLFLATGFVALVLNRSNLTIEIPPLVLSDHNQPLISSKMIKKRGLKDLVHELCETTIDGDSRPCSLERLSAILEELRKRNSLDALNTIPDQHQHGYKDTYHKGLSPLQYWVAQENLEAVQLLIKYGAQDYCYPMQTSALHTAIKHGYTHIVHYLLQNGATANVPFLNNALLFFIPSLIFHLSDEAQDKNAKKVLLCLEEALEHLSKTDPENLKLQLQIPVGADKDNILDHVLKSYEYAYNIYGSPDPVPMPIKAPLIALLRRFGAQEHDCVSRETLKERGYDDGGGFTLGDIARFK